MRAVTISSLQVCVNNLRSILPRAYPAFMPVWFPHVRLAENKSHREKNEYVCVCVCSVVANFPWQHGWHWQLWQLQLLSRWVIGLTGDKWGSVCMCALLCVQMCLRAYTTCVCVSGRARRKMMHHLDDYPRGDNHNWTLKCMKTICHPFRRHTRWLTFTVNGIKQLEMVRL